MLGAIQAEVSSLLDAERLKDAAAARIGHDRFGKYWEEGFACLLAALGKIGMSVISAERAARQIGVFLDARLYAQTGFSDHPEVLGNQISRPIFIAGLVRSGTTALHKLMSMDPQFQVTEHWLTMAPMPRPPRAAWDRIPAYRALAGYLDDNMEISPELKEHHGQAVDEADETYLIQAHTFCTNLFPSLYDIPDYDSWFRSADERPHYQYVADVLRLIGGNEPKRRWLLKNPTDLFSLAALLDVFPDALIIQTHRDPVQAIPSVCGTIASGRRMVQTEEPDFNQIGQRESGFYAETLRRGEEARSRTRFPPIDIEFQSFMADQMGTIRRIYDHFALVLSDDVESRMEKWLEANPRRSTSLQRVQPEEFGLTAEGLKATYADYREKRGYV